jgi:hypothetical protein
MDTALSVKGVTGGIVNNVFSLAHAPFATKLVLTGSGVEPREIQLGSILPPKPAQLSIAKR